jgi:DNA polymerase
MDARRAEVLQVLGIERFVPRVAGTVSRLAEAASVTRPVSLVAPGLEGADSSELRARVAECTRCGLSTTRTQTVFGAGDPGARWLIVMDAPGLEEERQGDPLVGAAGELLNAMLRAVGRTREQVFITNILKCRPPANREPKGDEVVACKPYLLRQIALQTPDLILCMGRFAAQGLLGIETPLATLRSRVHRLSPTETPVVVTYAPSYLLRAPGEKRKAWEDLKLARDVADGRAA